jgi:hypothetical protein
VRRLGRGTIAFAVLEVLLLAAIPVLGWVGFRTVLDTTEGQAVDPELDPAEPGYEAFLEPTPVALVLGLDADRALSWATVLGLGGSGGQGGSVLFVPTATRVVEGSETIASVWADEGQGATAAAIGELLDAGFTEVVVLEAARLAELFAPVAPLAVTIADDVADFEAGELALAGEEVVALLTARDEGESDLARLVRHEAVWEAWLGAVAASSNPDVVPGEAATGIGRFVRALAGGTVRAETAPVGEVETDDGSVFEADLQALRALVNERIPFPVASRPGGRPRVRVLDGIGVEGLALRAGRDVVRAGGQVTVIGNADRFDIPESRVVYFDGRVTNWARGIAEAFGIDDVQQLEGPNPNDLVDLTVVVGSDLAGVYGGAGG